MNLQQVRYFLELSKELHFWRTSEKMYITQSALSRHISALEQELGVQLFERNKRNVKLTPAGEFLSREWEKMLVEIENVHRHAKRICAGEIGEIRIGYPGSITYSVLPEVLEVFVRRYPELQVELIELVTMSLEQSLLNYRIDIGFKREPALNQALDSRKIATDSFALVVPENHFLTEENFTDLSQVKDERFILASTRGKHPYAQLLRRIFLEYDFSPHIYFESEFGSTILGLVGKGLGISVMPFTYSYHSPKNVRFIKIPHYTNLYVIWRKNDNNRVLDNFLEVIECAPSLRES